MGLASKISGVRRLILYGKSPYLVGFPKRYIIGCLGENSIVVCCHFSIAHTVPAYAFIAIQAFPHGLPGGRPIVFGIIITNIKVTSGLVEAVENIAEYPPVCAGLCEAVSSRIIGDDCTIIRRTKIVYPRCGSIRPVNHVFSVCIIKISISHIKYVLSVIYSKFMMILWAVSDRAVSMFLGRMTKESSFTSSSVPSQEAESMI